MSENAEIRRVKQIELGHDYCKHIATLAVGLIAFLGAFADSDLPADGVTGTVLYLVMVLGGFVVASSLGLSRALILDLEREDNKFTPFHMKRVWILVIGFAVWVALIAALFLHVHGITTIW